MNKPDVIEKFLRYVKIDTQSDDTTGTSPSTMKQHDLAKLLVSELKEIGASDIIYDEDHCYVYATIPSNINDGKDRPAIGFISHMDTSDEVSGKNVKPRIVEKYDGKDIVLNDKEKVILSPIDFPELSNHVGEDLIVTDGTTLLGADDKAGVAEIMTMAEILLTNPDLPHGEIKIAFTPDEEIGAGTAFFDVAKFGAKYAYTVDGGKLGDLEYENFNAASGKITVHGRSVHPGDAKNKMINAALICYEFHALLPVFMNPMYTEGREGFFHLTEVNGGTETATASYIIRDHDEKLFAQKKELFVNAAEYLNKKYGEGVVEVTVKDQYRNMIEKIRPHMHLIDNAKKAMTDLGVTPLEFPIRGGTDGASLSYMGLPCPNLCTGGYNYHGKYEYASIQEMRKVVDILLGIVNAYGKEF
ncbi:tripeptide aminopeptidase [Butyrivibrio hungatei DSM 14810]|uniref:Peptidase T n=1 Tax=Butyrivibrio hungatei DSM 14810 TaxID=1121132 RepID=A0A1M7SLQ8_9FIRM|nr:peptidase T [Butyrivibrio hungatei]SHN59397.1 tripeptide aminopeptidase [Butyrivibrio hungatei DSM 14810]